MASLDPLEQALQCESERPRGGLRWFRAADRRCQEVDRFVFSLAILSPALAALVAFLIAQRVASHRAVWTVLLLAAGYLLPLELWQRRRREWRPASQSERLFWYSYYVTEVLFGHLLLVAVVFAAAAIAGFLLSFPLRLAGIDIRQSLGLQVVLVVLAHVGVFVHYRGSWRDFWSYLTSLGMGAAVVGTGPAGLLYAHPLQAVLVHGIAGALKASALGRFTSEPVLSKIARLGQVRCLIRLGRREAAGRRLEELMNAAGTRLDGGVDKMASALTLLLSAEDAGESRLSLWLAAHRDDHERGWGQLAAAWRERFGAGDWPDFCLFFCVPFNALAAGEPDEPIEPYGELWRASVERTVELAEERQRARRASLERRATQAGDQVAAEKLDFLRSHGAAEGLAASAAKKLPPAAGPGEAVVSAAGLGRNDRLAEFLAAPAGWSPGLLKGALRAAVGQRQTEAVRLLLAAGAGAKSSGEEHRPILVDAAAAGSAPIVELLLAAGADPKAKAAQGYTALMAAAEGGHAKVIRRLLAAGADPEACGIFAPAIFFAVRRGDGPSVRALLAGGADPNARSADGRVNVLMRAVFDGRVRMAWLLLRAGADPRAATPGGTTAAGVAWRQGEVGLSLLFLLSRLVRPRGRRVRAAGP